MSSSGYAKIALRKHILGSSKMSTIPGRDTLCTMEFEGSVRCCNVSKVSSLMGCMTAREVRGIPPGALDPKKARLC